MSPLRWLWGLAPIAMLCWVAVLSERERIETELKDRVQNALTQAGLPWALTSFNGRDAVMTGQASDEPEPLKALNAARSTWGVRIVDDRTELLDKADVYIWSATERDSKLRLAGFVPNDSTRKAILGVAKAAFPKSSVEDAMKLARGAPARDTWLGGVSFALKNLVLLKNGTVELDGTNLTLSGRADDVASYKSVKSALTDGLPQGIRLKADRITAPVISPYTWSAHYERSEMLLGGHVPGDAQRRQVAEAAKTAFPRATIVDRMDVGDGAPDAFLGAAQAVLSELAKLDDGHAELRGNVLTVTGMASTDVVADGIKASLRERMPAAIRVAEAIKFKAAALPTFNPFRTTVEATTQTVALNGHVPSPEAKAALGETARARFPGRRIDNNLVVGNGAPPAWQACMQFAIAGLSRVGAGKATLNNRKLEVSGETTDEALHAQLPGEIEKSAGQSCDTDVNLVLRELPEPSLGWKATRHDGQLVLDGEVPDAAAKTELAETASRLFPGMGINDRTRIANVPPRRWTQVAVAGLQQLARLRSGEAQIRGQQLSVSGEAGDRAIAVAVHEAVSQRLARGYTGRDSITIRTEADIAAEADARRRAEEEARRRGEDEARRRAEEDAHRRQEMAALEARRKAEQDAESKRRTEAAAADARRKAEQVRCQTELRAVSKSGVILFERASADINAKSFATLEALARTLKACPEVMVEIEGHTDIEGAPDRNQRLSERRAQSVLQHLTTAGADASRLSAVGYGQDRPIASNDTPDGRAKNRRIEFTVKSN